MAAGEGAANLLQPTSRPNRILTHIKGLKSMLENATAFFIPSSEWWCYLICAGVCYTYIKIKTLMIHAGLCKASASINRNLALDSHPKVQECCLFFSLFTHNWLIDGYDYRAVTVRVCLCVCFGFWKLCPQSLWCSGSKLESKLMVWSHMGNAVLCELMSGSLVWLKAPAALMFLTCQLDNHQSGHRHKHIDPISAIVSRI